MSLALAAWRNLLAEVGCVVCHRNTPTGERVELHHIAEGSGQRDEWGCVPICSEHHRGGSGFHGMGSKAFCALYRPPGDSEPGMLIWTMQDVAKHLHRRGIL